MIDRPHGLRVERTGGLGADELAAVLDLVAAATRADGAAPLNEAALLNLRHGHAGVEHLLAVVGDAVVGYGQLDGEQPDRTGALVVRPDHRRRGAGAALLDAMTARGPLRVWAMGDSPAAQSLARAGGLRPVRELLIMKRSLADPVQRVEPPDGVTIRTFAIAADEEEWLAVNARAFAWHPEQGRMTLTDLRERMAEPWFDPAGFFVAVRDAAPSRGDDGSPGSLDLERDWRRSGGAGGSPRPADAESHMIGFHWTKQHPGWLGEVYVLGVDPAAAGLGLGKALLAAGLEHLRERGSTEVELYTESDNEQALHVYFGYGFAVASRDVMYASAEIAPGSGGLSTAGGRPPVSRGPGASPVASGLGGGHGSDRRLGEPGLPTG